MRITVIQPYALDEQYSMLRFGSGLADALTAAGDDVRSVQPPAMFGHLGRRGSAVRKWAGYIDKYLLAPLVIWRARRGADIVHVVDQGSAMYVHALDPKRTLVTVHDLFAVETMLGAIEGRTLGRTGRWQQQWILSGLRRARHFTSVSGATAMAMRRVLGPQVAVEVIPNALAPHYCPASALAVAAVRARAGVPDGARYFIHVGGNSFYKNRPGVVRLFDELACTDPDCWLVLAGKAPDADLWAAIAAAAASDRILVMTDASDDEIVALYTGARALLFISLMEGFGWPILEAQVCGCPVVTTDRDPMRSVAGAAILVPPDAPDQAAAIVTVALHDTETLRRDGLANAANYAPDRVYSRYRDLYRAIQSTP